MVEADQIGSQPVTLDQDDYDDAYGDKGYINASAAQSILSTQLGRDDLQFVEKEYDLGRRGVRGGVRPGRRGVRV